MSVRPITGAASNLGGTVYNVSGNSNSIKTELASDNTGGLSMHNSDLKRVRAYWNYGSGNYNRPYSLATNWYIRF